MRILITGASGLLGGRIFEYLKKNKIKIIIASRRIKKLKHYKFKKINWNSNQNLEKLCSKIDVIEINQEVIDYTLTSGHLDNNINLIQGDIFNYTTSEIHWENFR